jgi:hypothetical protein
MKKLLTVNIVLSLLVVCSVSPRQVAAGVSTDANGWTMVTPSGDSRIIYVSFSTGNDSTGVLNDINHPYKTIAKANTLRRQGYPDWVLLKCGDIWYESFGQQDNLGGRSATEPMLFSSYGSGARPQMRPGSDTGFGSSGYHNTNPCHVYYIGLEVYGSHMDPASPDFIHDSNGKATATSGIGFVWVDEGTDILVEDCFFHFCSMGCYIDLINPLVPYIGAQDLRIRRNVITDQYAIAGHPQGIFTGSVTNFRIEENIFDHNAWNDAGPPAGVFNHDLYLNDMYNLTISSNVFLRTEMLSNKITTYRAMIDASVGVTIENNFYFEGVSSIWVGYGAADNTIQGLGGSCFRNYMIRNNVFSQVDRDNPTGQNLGLGIDIETICNSEISNNIFTNFCSLPDGLSNTKAIEMGEYGQPYFECANINISNNLIYRVKSFPLALDLYYATPPLWTNIYIASNTIQDGGLGVTMITTKNTATLPGVRYASNIYSTSIPAHFANVSGTYVTSTTWISQMGETGLQFKTVSYPDPNRTLDTYAAQFGMTLDQFYVAVRAQSKANWNPNYTAAAINDYIRGGFGLPPLGSGVPSGKTPSAPRGLRIR